MASSDTAGVRPMTIEGRVAFERERLIGMTKEERAWRARYLKSLTLAPEEPVIPENYYKERYNPIRRFYRAPMNAVEKALTPAVVRKRNAQAFNNNSYHEKRYATEIRDHLLSLLLLERNEIQDGSIYIYMIQSLLAKNAKGEFAAGTIRFVSAKLVMGIIGIYGLYYHIKYNRATWLSRRGIHVQVSGPAIYPSSPEYKTRKLAPIEGKDFYSFGFEKSPI